MKTKVVAVVTAVIVGMVSASAEFESPTPPVLPVPGAIKHVYGDKEILEGNEGYIEVVVEAGSHDGSTPRFEHVSGVNVQISVKPDSPYIATIIPDKVSANTPSTVRVTAAGSSIDYTFTVVNEAEPEQTNGNTIAQCSFFSDREGHTGFAGTGAFSFDKRTVDNIVIGDGLYSDRIISTTRKIDWLYAPGLPIVGTDWLSSIPGEEDSFDSVFTLGLSRGNFAGDIWYAGLGYQAGTAESRRFVWYGHILVDGWTTFNREQSYGDPLTGGFSFGRSDDSVAHGDWNLLLDTPAITADGRGYFDCTLSDEGDMSVCGGTYTLENNEWKQISLPCLVPVHHTVLSMFPNMPGSYGKDWVVYRYGNVWQEGTNEYKYQYKKIEPEESLKQGQGYWIIQASGASVTLSMPKGSIPALVSTPPACISSKGCSATSVKGKKHWDMIGYPFAQAGALDDLRIALTDLRGGSSTGYQPQKGWNLDDAKKQGIVHNQLWSYTGKGYKKINVGDSLEPWNAYWLWTLAENKEMSLLFPKP